MLVDQPHQLLIDLAHQHHLDDSHGLLIGDPQAADKGWLEARKLHRPGDLRAAAMDDDRMHPDVPHQNDVQDHRPLQPVIAHRRAAVLDHHGLAGERLDVGQRLDQDIRLVDGGLHIQPLRLGHLLSPDTRGYNG